MATPAIPAATVAKQKLRNVSVEQFDWRVAAPAMTTTCAASMIPIEESAIDAGSLFAQTDTPAATISIPIGTRRKDILRCAARSGHSTRKASATTTPPHPNNAEA